MAASRCVWVTATAGQLRCLGGSIAWQHVAGQRGTVQAEDDGVRLAASTSDANGFAYKPLDGTPPHAGGKQGSSLMGTAVVQIASCCLLWQGGTMRRVHQTACNDWNSAWHPWATQGYLRQVGWAGLRCLRGWRRWSMQWRRCWRRKRQIRRCSVNVRRVGSVQAAAGVA